MNTIQRLLPILAIITIMLNPVYALEGTELPAPLNYDKVNNRLQTDYALKIGQETVNALKAFKARYNKPMSEKTFEWFSGELLLDGSDPIIQSITYVPDTSLTITLHSNDRVEPELHGLTFIYTYEPEAGTWVLDRKHSSGVYTSPRCSFHEMIRRIRQYCGRVPLYRCHFWHHFLRQPLPYCW